MEDSDYEKLSKLKGKLSWKDFIFLMFTHCLDAKKRGDFDIEK